MRSSKIELEIILDDQNVPEKLLWDADDKQGEGQESTKSVFLAIWDHQSNSIMKIDLWTKDMLVGEMKRFYIQMIGSMSEGILNATQDEEMARMLAETAESLAQHLMREERGSKQ